MRDETTFDQQTTDGISRFVVAGGVSIVRAYRVFEEARVHLQHSADAREWFDDELGMFTIKRAVRRLLTGRLGAGCTDGGPATAVTVWLSTAPLQAPMLAGSRTVRFREMLNRIARLCGLDPGRVDFDQVKAATYTDFFEYAAAGGLGAQLLARAYGGGAALLPRGL